MSGFWLFNQRLKDRICRIFVELDADACPRSSGNSFSCRRAETGMSRVCACLSIASSAMLIALGPSL